jgi:hypothetical protein
MNQIGTLTQKEIINLGFEYERDWGWYKKYTVKIYTETKSFYRRVTYVQLQHTENYRTGKPMPVIKLLIRECQSDDWNEVLYEGECLNLEELTWILLKTLDIKIVDNKILNG